MEKLKVIVLMGGRTPEHQVSLVTGREVVKYLDRNRYTTLPVVISRDGTVWQLKTPDQILLQSPAGVGKNYNQVKTKAGKSLQTGGQPTSLTRLVSEKPDVVFIAMHGPFGEDGTIQGMLELAGLPYTGSGVLASALGMDKIMFRKVMDSEKIPTPRYLVFDSQDSTSKIWQFFSQFPIIVKPYNQGSSVGVSIVHSRDELPGALKSAFSYSNPILVEEYLKGVEVSCGVLGNKTPAALPVAEIVPKNEFFDYEAKYTPGRSEEIIPARIPPKITRQVQETAVRVFQAIGARGFARIDMVVKNNKPIVLEINTIPGLTSVSILPKEAAAAGISYPELLDKIISLALENH